jgi:hypothetical protein
MMVLLLGLLLTACNADSSDDQPQGRSFHLIAVSQHQSDINIQTKRAAIEITDPNDATVIVSYDNYVSETSIHTYITTSNRLDFYGDFEYDGSNWSTKVPLDNDTYYIFGFMPSNLKNTATIEPRNSSYTNGAVITIGNVPALMTEPLCAIVGVKRAENGTTPMSSTTDMKRGVYSYEVTQSDADNYVYMLLDHLYSCVRFTMSVDAEYYALRRIHLKEFNITPKAGTINVRATLTAGSFNTLTIGYTKTSDYSGEGVNLWEVVKDIELNENTTTPGPNKLYEITGCKDLYIAPSDGNTEFTIHCKYDVYDRKGNLIRQNCEASNTLSLGGTGWKAGERYTVPLVVMPTYLYVLSEPDLDNPTIN